MEFNIYFSACSVTAFLHILYDIEARVAGNGGTWISKCTMWAGLLIFKFQNEKDSSEGLGKVASDLSLKSQHDGPVDHRTCSKASW